MVKLSTLFSNKKNEDAIELLLVSKDFKAEKWAQHNGFSGRDGEVLFTANMTVLVGYGDKKNPFFWANLCEKISNGIYNAPKLKSEEINALVLGWCLAHYSFDKYKKINTHTRKLILPNGADYKNALIIAEGIFITRDLINTPANDLNPATMEDHIVKMGAQFKAVVKTIKGKALEKSFPLIHTVGRASDTPPRLVELNWGKKTNPTLTLVGKGITFDTGGLDLKPSASMLTMKKDMGGAGNVLGLAYMIMKSKLPVQLRVLIPTAENMISSNAYRPSDILQSHKGLTVEVGNTDAEGRLVLADALSYASQKTTDLTIDMATLTGAARVAVGTGISAFFSTDKKLSDSYMKMAEAMYDPSWELPLHKPYRKQLDSNIADISSTGSSGMAGATLAGLFLQEFVDNTAPWMHFDIMAYNPASSAGKPIGGEAMGIRAVFAMLEKRYK